VIGPAGFMAAPRAKRSPPPALPRDFGDGWMTRNARDLAKIAVTFGGFDAKLVARRLAAVNGRGSRINAATVERVLHAIRQEHK